MPYLYIGNAVGGDDCDTTPIPRTLGRERARERPLRHWPLTPGFTRGCRGKV